MNYRSISQLRKAIFKLIRYLPHDIQVVVGVPRSGLLAANLLALYKNLPLTDVEGLLNDQLFNHGVRLSQCQYNGYLKERKKILVLDDSVSSGTSILKVKNELQGLNHDLVYAAVYSTPAASHLVDYYAETVPQPRCFEWNVMHHPMLLNCCLDIDGVLCQDPNENDNDDDQNYLYFLKHAKPFFLPNTTIGYLVTNRLEKYRSQTIEWLEKHDVKYQKLFMLNMPSKSVRQATNCHAKFKANIYVYTNASLFIESSYKQACEIANLSGKPVFSVETHEMIYPSIINKLHGSLFNKIRKIWWRFPVPKSVRLKAKNIYWQRKYDFYPKNQEYPK